MLRQSSRSPLTSILRESLDVIREAKSRRVAVEEVVEERKERRPAAITRREFLGTAAVVGTGLAIGLPFHARAAQSRIVVVGAGLAGVRFAHYMWTKNNITTTVYEANTRLGGRVWSNRNFFTSGLIAEQGGEFIDSTHSSMLNLVKRLHLKLQVTFGGSEPCCNDIDWLNGHPYTKFASDLNKLQPAIDAAFNSAPVTTYNHFTQAGYKLDHMSVTDWLSQNCPGGVNSNLARILLTMMLAEFGLEPTVQSALNFIYQFGGPGPANDEKYYIVGGNDQIVTGMVAELPPGSIQTGMSLVALVLNSDGTYACTFQQGASTVNVTADHVVLALPFPQLRKVDLSRAGFSSVKVLAINGFDLGTNAKIAMEFNNRVWSNQDNLSGAAFSDPSFFQECWEGTVGALGKDAILEQFVGGNAGGPNAFPGSPPHGPAPASVVQSFLSEAEGPFPGLTAAYIGPAYLGWWSQDPFIGGSYGCYQIGNYTSFSGIEAQREGNVHFCGEQTSLSQGGFMEGAVRSAERLASHWPNR